MKKTIVQYQLCFVPGATFVKKSFRLVARIVSVDTVKS